MKRSFITTLLSLFVALVAMSCQNNEKEIEIGFESLPQEAQVFVKVHFPNTKYSRVVQEKDHGTIEYEVWLSDGTELEFDASGNWKSVDCRFSSLPVGIIPYNIAVDINKRYPDAKPYKIEKKHGGYEIDIPGYDLYYNSKGEFVRAEIDR